MIINSQAFNARGADARRIYMELDEFCSRKPIDVNFLFGNWSPRIIYILKG